MKAGHIVAPRNRQRSLLVQKRSSGATRSTLVALFFVTPPGPHTPKPELWVATMGQVPYAEAVALQERIRAARQAGEVPDSLLLLEHPPVYTKGRRTETADLPMGEEWYEMQGIEVASSDRGGRVTYHGPGQLVGYPIVEVSDVPAYVASLEGAIVSALADEGVGAEVREDVTGVWAGHRKIGSIGVHVSRGVTTHGFAVNVDCDLQPFEWVVPCGIEGARMTSLYVETGRTGGMYCFRKRMAWRLAEALGRRQRLVSIDRLAGAPEAVPA
jgi:lipoate-protein ligase B